MKCNFFKKKWLRLKAYLIARKIIQLSYINIRTSKKFQKANLYIDKYKIHISEFTTEKIVDSLIKNHHEGIIKL